MSHLRRGDKTACGLDLTDESVAAVANVGYPYTPGYPVPCPDCLQEANIYCHYCGHDFGPASENQDYYCPRCLGYTMVIAR